jgi:hypothetical protein
VIYLHPWELDPGQPRPPASTLTLLRHRIGIGSMERKLRAILGEFRFGTMSAVLAAAQPSER